MIFQSARNSFGFMGHISITQMFLDVNPVKDTLTIVSPHHQSNRYDKRNNENVNSAMLILM